MLSAATVLPLAASEAAVGMGVAALIGLAVGIERQWSGHAEGPDARFAGARTFFLLGGAGGIAGVLLMAGAVALSAVLLGGAALLVAAAYVLASRRGSLDPDATTEVAAVVVLGLGVIAGLGHLRLASAAGVVVVLALNEKSRIHEFVRHIDDWELRGALQFAVLALVVLPLMPKGPFGPLGGIYPQSLWLLVLLFSGLNFLGFVARRGVGVRRGYAYAGLAGGLISSTAVTLNFARRSRIEPEAGRGLAAGVVAACTILVIRVTGITFVLNPDAGWALLPMAFIPLAAGTILTAWAFRPGTEADDPAAEPMTPPSNPLRLGSAIRLALLFQGALMALTWVQGRFGDPGVLPLAAFLGLTDMDALTVSMAKLATDGGMVRLAAEAIMLGMLSNTVLKLTVAVTLGTSQFRRLAGAGLAYLGLATLLALLLI
ncbi:MAG: MgtC/SapB family protein [Gemmatimonadales bacterium]